MGTFGQRLRQERERRGIMLDEVADATKVGTHLLEALERNDLSSLPGGPFNRGFVRAYAKYIGLDPEVTIDDYSREEKTQGLRTPDADKELMREMSRLIELRSEGDRKTLVLDTSVLKRAAIGAAAVAAVLLAAWLWLGSGDSDPVTPPVLAATAEPESTAATPPDMVIDNQESAPPDVMPGKPPAQETTVATEPPRDSPGEPADTEVAAPSPPREPEPTTSTEPPRQEPVPAGRLSITDFGVGTGVVNRQLVGRGQSFPEGTHVWFWTRTLGGTAGDAMQHVWMLDGSIVATYDLNIGGPHWRNSSRKTLRPGSVGRWVVEARDAGGRVLARQEFQCVAP